MATSGRRRTRGYEAPFGADLSGTRTRLRFTVIGCAVIAGIRYSHVADEEPEVTRLAPSRRRQRSKRDARGEDRRHEDEGLHGRPR